MVEERTQRRLAAILAADVAGYSRLMGADEEGTLAQLKAHRQKLVDPAIIEHRGRVVKTTGDGILAEFSSVVDALQCAVRLQHGMAERNKEVSSGKRIAFRIGINVGDIVVEDGDIYGDGVNIAARLESLADPGGICVSGRVQEDVRGKLDIVFDDLGEQKLKNIAWPVRVHRARLGDETATPQLALMLPDRPSIAVLPFQNMSGDPEQEFFVDGLTEDIIMALSHVSTFWVIARASTFAYKGKQGDIRRIGRELGVRYVIEGSVRRTGDRLRVTTQMIEAETGRQLWAERYDRPLADLFDIQDEISRGVVSSIETQVFVAEGEAAKSRLSADFRARDLVARAIARSCDETLEAYAEASDLIEEAIRIDPLTPRAQLMRGTLFLEGMYSGKIPHDAANEARALDLARIALRLAPRDEWAHWLMAGAYAEAGQLEEAVAECERSLEINPNFGMALGRMGGFLVALGRHQEAIEKLRLALLLDPRNQANYWRHSNIGVAHFVAEDYEAAMRECKRVIQSRQHMQSMLIWAASAAALGKTDEAATAVQHCLAERSDVRIGNVVPDWLLRFANAEHHDRLLSLLRKAGLPE